MMSATTGDASLGALPRQVGKYTLLRKLATGGMAELFLAIHRSLGGFEKLVVIKRILPSMTEDRAYNDMLLHEARIAATMSHPNIVHVFDVGRVDGAHFIAMEHVHGEDLRAVVRQLHARGAPEFPVEHAVSIALGVCAGLAYAHEKRDLSGTSLDIVHRDISPHNIVVTFSGDAKIVDFGIAKSSANFAEETGTGRLKGKVQYMSPEQARGDSVDWRSDLFALSVILFELTTGRRLFKAASDYETFKLICERDVPRPSSIRPGYPSALESIVMRGLAKDRRMRWQSAREMQAALEEFVRESRIAASRSGLSEFMRALFADKLLRQGEAMMHDKQLADRFGGGDAASESGFVGAPPASFGPTAARTVTDATPARSNRAVFLAGTLGLFAVLGVGAEVTLSPTPLERVHDAVARRQRAAPSQAEPRQQQQQPQPQEGVVALASSPPGAAIFVNGELSAETTPATFGHVELGTPYNVTMAANGFTAASRTVTLTDENPNGAVRAVLEPCQTATSAGPTGIPF